MKSYSKLFYQGGDASKRPDPRIMQMRPFTGADGRAYVTAYSGKGDPSKAKNYKNMQANAKGTLRRDQWRQIDDSILQIQKNEPSGFQYFLNNDALRYNLENPMSYTVFEYADSSDSFEAELSMDGLVKADNDRIEFDMKGIPLPILHVDYEINERFLMQDGQLDPLQAQLATKAVIDKRENLLFGDEDYSYGGGTIYSFTSAPNRNTATISTSWETASGEAILDDVLSWKQTLRTNGYAGPSVLIAPPNYEKALQKDYKAESDRTVEERILAVDGIEDVIIVDKLADDNALLVRLSPEVIRIIDGMGMQNIQWKEQGGFVNRFKVLNIQIPQIRADQEGKSGIVHASV